MGRHHLCSAMQPLRVTQHSLPLLAGIYNSSFLAKALPFTRNEVEASGVGRWGGRGSSPPPLGLFLDKAALTKSSACRSAISDTEGTSAAYRVLRLPK